jgi:TetR/AcrR family transcriptional regulator
VIIINHKFFSLKPEKRERIINAALKEFAKNGYDKASTNEIVKESGISKGSLFNYFISKKELYLFLLDYVVKVIEQMYDEVDWSETDFFKRMRQFGLVKFKTYKKFPHVFDFINAVTNEDAAEVRPEIKSISKDLISSGLERAYENIDFTRFRDDIDIKKSIDIINCAILGLAEQKRNRVSSFADVGIEVLDEFDEYFKILERCFYKEGER